MVRRAVRIAVLLAAITPGLTGAVEWVSLDIRDVAPEALAALTVPPATVVAAGRASLLVVGTFSHPAFAVPGIANVRLVDGAGQPLPLVVEKASLFAEFDEINSMRFAFELPPAALGSGLPRLEWGREVQGQNRLVERLAVDAGDSARVRTFVSKAGASPGSAQPQFATVEVVADSHADTYYLWYLVPMALIFALLGVRKFLRA